MSKTVTHSEKALETLSLLGLTPADCGLIPIKWEKRSIEVPTKVYCNTCQHVGRCYVDPEGKPFDFYKEPWTDTIPNWNRHELIKKHNLVQERCPDCPPRRNYPTLGTGEVVKMVLREVTVGIIQYVPGSQSDSRFNDGGHCQLCNKTIKKSGRVPIHGKDQTGLVHNLFVGEDCARKFGGVEKKFPTDHFLEENL